MRRDPGPIWPSTLFRRSEESNTSCHILVRGFFPANFARFRFSWVHKPGHDGGSPRSRHWLSADPTFQFVLRYDAVAVQASAVAVGHGLLRAKKLGESMEQVYRSLVPFVLRFASGCAVIQALLVERLQIRRPYTSRATSFRSATTRRSNSGNKPTDASAFSSVMRSH